MQVYPGSCAEFVSVLLVLAMLEEEVRQFRMLSDSEETSARALACTLSRIASCHNM
jgi:hypothetical protein